MDTNAHLDWLAVTFPDDLEQGFVLPAKLHQSPLQKKPGVYHNYQLIMTNEIGVLVFSQGAPKEGTHVCYKGDPLHVVREIGITDVDLLRHVMEYNGKLTRLDVAVNIHDGMLKAADLEAEYMADRVKTRAHSASRALTLHTDRDTLYIGSRASERLFRAYNKGAQLHLDEAWLRLELECKKLMARTVGKAIADSDNPRAVMNRAIKDYVDFPDLPEYQAALADLNATIPRPVRKMHSTYKWLLETVAPALARYQFEHPDEDIETAFLTMWAHHLKELRDHAPDDRK